MRAWHRVNDGDPVYDQLYTSVIEARRKIRLYHGSRSKSIIRVERLTEELATALRKLREYTDQFDQDISLN